MNKTFIADYALVKDFAQNLSSDIQRLGHTLVLYEHANGLGLEISRAESILSEDDLKNTRDQAFTLAHENLIKRNSEKVKELKEKHDLEYYFPKIRIDTKRIELSIHPIKKDEISLPNLLSLYPRATSFPKGRRVDFLVWDTGQKKPCLVGLLTLASPQYFHTGRDKLLNWIDAETLEPIQPRKNQGLRSIYNIANSFAFSCYQKLFASKIVTLSAFTDVVRDTIFTRYGQEPLAFTTSAIFGSYATPFQRINTRDFESLSSDIHKTNRCFFETLPSKSVTRPSLSEALSDTNFRLAFRISDAAGGPSETTTSKSLGRKERHEALTIALKQLGIPSTILLGGQTRSYFGFARQDCVDALRNIDSKTPTTPPCINSKELEDYWKSRWIGVRGRDGEYEYSVVF